MSTSPMIEKMMIFRRFFDFAMMSVYKDKLNGDLFREIRIPSHLYDVHWNGPMAKKRVGFRFLQARS